MANLTPKQESLLAFASEADDRYRSAKLNARKRAQEVIEREIAAFAAARDKAVWDAIEGGVPKRQVGLLALKTTSPNTVHEIYNRVLESQEFVDVELAIMPVDKYQWSEVFTLPNGFQIWFLIVDGDDYVSTVPNFRDGESLEHPGYIYMHYGSNWGNVPPLPPTIEAQQWAEQNRPGA